VIIKLFDSRTQFTHIPGLHDAILNNEDTLTDMQIDLALHYPEYIHATVDRIESNQLVSSDGSIHEFNYCVIATGSRTKFPHDEASRQYAYTLNYACDVIKLNDILREPCTKRITIIGG